MKDKKGRVKSGPDEAITGDIVGTGFLDSHGRLYIAQRDRDKAGLRRDKGYSVQILGKILSEYEETLE